MRRHIKKACHGSHIPVLKLIFRKINIKKILEFGIGENSTLFFRKEGFDFLMSIDNSRKWLERFTENKPDNHTMILYEKDDSYMVDVIESFDLVFVDGHPAESRIDCVNVNIPKSKVVVVHDMEHRKLNLKKIIIPDGYTRFDFKPTHPKAPLPETSMIIRDDLIDDEIRSFFKKVVK